MREGKRADRREVKKTKPSGLKKPMTIIVGNQTDQKEGDVFR